MSVRTQKMIVPSNCSLKDCASRSLPLAEARFSPGTDDRKKQILLLFPHRTRLLAGLAPQATARHAPDRLG